MTSAKREIYEETGLMVDHLQLCAVYNIDAGEATGIVLFVFTAQSNSRDVIANDEGTLHWLPQSEVMNYDLVEDLPIILPRILHKTASLPFFIHVSYDKRDQIEMRFAGD